MTHYGRRSVIVLFLALLAMPAGIALADQGEQEGGFSPLVQVERFVLQLQGWIVAFMDQPNDERTRSSESTANERGEAVQKIGINIEPNG